MFDFLKRRAGKKDGGKRIVAVADGMVIPMEQVGDPVFAGKMMGDGVAIVPTGNVVVAPCAGTITMIAGTGHAFGMTCGGLEFLVHIGIDTVSLGGRGFHVLAKAGDQVAAGTPVIAFDRAVMNEACLDMTIPVILLDDGGKEIRMFYPQPAKAGMSVVMEFD